MRRKDRYMAVIGKSFGMSGFEYGSGVTLVSRNGDDHIYFVIFDEIIHGFKEIVHGNKVKFSVEL